MQPFSNSTVDVQMDACKNNHIVIRKEGIKLTMERIITATSIVLDSTKDTVMFEVCIIMHKSKIRINGPGSLICFLTL